MRILSHLGAFQYGEDPALTEARIFHHTQMSALTGGRGFRAARTSKRAKQDNALDRPTTRVERLSEMICGRPE